MKTKHRTILISGALLCLGAGPLVAQDNWNRSSPVDGRDYTSRTGTIHNANRASRIVGWLE